MTRLKLLALGVGLAVALVPGFAGAHSQTSCNGITNEAGGTTTDITVANPVTGDAIAYVNLDDTNDTEAGHAPNAFLESNNWAGLQTHAHHCRPGPNGTPFIDVPADQNVLP